MKKVLIALCLASSFASASTKCFTEKQLEEATRPALNNAMCIGFALGNFIGKNKVDPTDLQYVVTQQQCAKDPYKYMDRLEKESKK